jgi:hypothetical protein
VPWLLLIPAASAATLTVDATGAGGAYTTIGAAIAAASSGDTLSIRAGTYTGPVDTDGKDLVLQGASASTVFIEGAPDEALNIDQGETVTVRALTLRGSGQGAEVRGATATFDDVTISGNSGIVAGGGIGVFAGADVTLTDCTIESNTVTGSYNGGGLYVDSSTLRMDGVLIDGNTANQGGGVYVFGGDVEATDTTISGNTAATHGGGIRIRSGASLLATRLVVQGNEAAGRGGGVSGVSADTSWTASEVRDNTAGTGGGGLHLDGALVSGSAFDGEISGNTAGGAGAGVFLNNHDLDLAGTLADNIGGASADGIGLYAVGASVSLTDAEVEGHQGVDGAGLYLYAGSSLALVRTTLRANDATGNGGAIYLEGALVAEDSDLEDNTAGAAGGGAWIDGAAVELDGVRFSGNEAGAAGGGGGLLLREGSLTAASTTFDANSAGYGGGVALIGSGVEEHDLRGVTFTGNGASADGGGLFLTDADTVLVAAGLFSANLAGVGGGGASLDDIGTLTLRHTDWLGNSARVGGGLAATGLGGGRTVHNDFAGNAASTAAGARFGAPAGSHPIANSRFYENDGDGLVISGDTAGLLPISNIDASANTGAGVSFGSAPLASIHSSIAAFNGGAGFTADATSASGMTLAWSASHGNGVDWGGSLPALTGTDGNIDDDPEYARLTVDGDPSGDLLLLSSTSPCRDAGDPGRSDPDGTRADMGSYGGPGAADADLDDDGYSLSDGDCDDTDPSAYPGAEETWYDDVDQDCAGGDDWDADADGHRSELHPDGDDCDDTDPAVNPSAADDTTDGVDQDCDGVDGTGGGDDGGGTGGGDDGGGTGGDEAEDADRDGVPAGEDCNDAEPAAFPGNPEDCTDGVDNDCDGFVDDLDADCIPKGGGGCSAVGGGGRDALVGTLLALGMLLSGRRRRRPRPSSGR